MKKTIDERIQEKGFWYDSYGNCCVDYTSVVELIVEQRERDIEKACEVVWDVVSPYVNTADDCEAIQNSLRKAMEE